jgi:hypothetical protein
MAQQFESAERARRLMNKASELEGLLAHLLPEHRPFVEHQIAKLREVAGMLARETELAGG